MRDPAALPKPRILTHARGGARWSEHKENAYIFEQYRMEGTLFDASIGVFCAFPVITETIVHNAIKIFLILLFFIFCLLYTSRCV